MAKAAAEAAAEAHVAELKRLFKEAAVLAGQISVGGLSGGAGGLRDRGGEHEAAEVAVALAAKLMEAGRARMVDEVRSELRAEYMVAADRALGVQRDSVAAERVAAAAHRDAARAIAMKEGLLVGRLAAIKRFRDVVAENVAEVRTLRRRVAYDGAVAQHLVETAADNRESDEEEITRVLNSYSSCYLAQSARVDAALGVMGRANFRLKRLQLDLETVRTHCASAFVALETADRARDELVD